MNNYKSIYIDLYMPTKDKDHDHAVAEVAWDGTVIFTKPMDKLTLIDIMKLHQAATRQYTDTFETTAKEYKKLRGQE